MCTVVPACCGSRHHVGMRASSTHVKQKATQRTRHPPRGTRPKRRALLLPTYTSITSFAAGVS
eukprot:615275-Prymnesium_polylepis.1